MGGGSKHSLWNQGGRFFQKTFEIATFGVPTALHQMKGDARNDRQDTADAAADAQRKLDAQMAEQTKQAAALRLEEAQRPKVISPDNSIPNRLRRQLAMRMGMQSTMTEAGSLVAPTQQKTKLGQ